MKRFATITAGLPVLWEGFPLQRCPRAQRPVCPVLVPGEPEVETLHQGDWDSVRDGGSDAVTAEG